MENHHLYEKINYKWQFSIAMLVYQRVNMVKTLDLDGKSLAPNDDLNGINQMISDDLRVSPDFF